MRVRERGREIGRERKRERGRERGDEENYSRQKNYNSSSSMSSEALVIASAWSASGWFG